MIAYLTALLLPPPACYQTEEERHQAYAAAMEVDLPASLTQVIVQAATPAPADQDKFWVELDSGGFSLGARLFQNGAWLRVEPLSPSPGIVEHFYGNANVPLTGNFATDAAAILLMDGGTALNPFWRVCDGTNGTPDLRGKMMIGAGQGAGLTNRTLNDVGGEETHLQTVAELPAHHHAFTYYNTITAADGGNPNYVSSALGLNGTADSADTGGATAFNVMNPFNVCYLIQRTSRLR